MSEREKRPFLKPASFGDQMPMVLTIDHTKDDAPWFWEDQSKMYDGKPNPTWLYSVTDAQEKQWTLDGNEKITRAIAELEHQVGALGAGTVINLTKTIVGKRHDWSAVVVNHVATARQPVEMSRCTFVSEEEAQQPQGGSTPPAGQAPGQSPPPASTAGGGRNGAAGAAEGLMHGKDVFMVPWSKPQMQELREEAATAATQFVMELVELLGEKEQSVPDVGSAWQGALSTFMIHAQKSADPRAYGPVQIPEHLIDQLLARWKSMVQEAGLDMPVANAVLAMQVLEGVKFGVAVKNAIEDFETFKVLCVQQSQAGEEPPPPEGPGSTTVTEDDIPF